MKVTTTDERENFCLRCFFLLREMQQQFTCGPDVTIVRKTFWVVNGHSNQDNWVICNNHQIDNNVKDCFGARCTKKIVRHAKTIQMQNLHQQ